MWFSRCIFLAFLSMSIQQQEDKKADMNKMRTYTAILEKTESVEGEGNYFDHGSLRVSKFNRTTTVLNGTLHIIKDIPIDTIASVTSYQKYGTEYKRSMIQVKSVKLCDLIENEQIIYPGILEVSNMPNKCPVFKGSKYIKNYVVNEDYLPEVFPGEYWRFDIILTHEEEIILHRRIYVRFEQKMKHL